MKRASLLLAACLLGSMPAAAPGQASTTTATNEPSVTFGSSNTSVMINHNPRVVVQSGKAVVTGPWVSGVMTGCAGSIPKCIDIRDFKRALGDLQK